MTVTTPVERPCILLVDDEEALVWSVSNRVVKVRPDYTVLPVTDGRAALRVLAARQVDLLITDIRMPEMSGLELIVAARRLHRSLPVIVMTAYPTAELPMDATLRGSIDYLQKPFDFDRFLALMEEALERKNQGFSGAISVQTLPDIVQLYALSNATGALWVRRRGIEGRIWFEHGTVTHATAGELSGEEAFHTIMIWSGGEFSMLPGEAAPRRSIRASWTELLMESCRRLDDLRRNVESQGPVSTRGWNVQPLPGPATIEPAHTEHVVVDMMLGDLDAAFAPMAPPVTPVAPVAEVTPPVSEGTPPVALAPPAVERTPPVAPVALAPPAVERTPPVAPVVLTPPAVERTPPVAPVVLTPPVPPAAPVADITPPVAPVVLTPPVPPAAPVADITPPVAPVVLTPPVPPAAPVADITPPVAPVAPIANVTPQSPAQASAPGTSLKEELASAGAAHQPLQSPLNGIDIATAADSLIRLNDIDGVIGVALMDAESGKLVASRGGGPALDIDAAGASCAEIVRCERRVLSTLHLEDDIEDFVVALASQYHVIRPIRARPSLLLYLALDRSRANLALARLTLADVEHDLHS